MVGYKRRWLNVNSPNFSNAFSALIELDYCPVRVAEVGVLMSEITPSHNVEEAFSHNVQEIFRRLYYGEPITDKLSDYKIIEL